MKVNVKKCLIIILASSILGLIYNFVNPSGISLISKRKQVKWASDSIILSSLKPVDTFHSNLETKTLEEAKSPINKKSDNLISKLKSDSTRQKLPKPIIKSNIDEDQGFSEPIGINLEQAYKLYTRGIIFIDARDEYEYKMGHIKNSINLPMYYFDKYKNVWMFGINPSDIAIDAVKTKIINSYNNMYAQTRKVASYGFLQLLYTTAYKMGYNKGVSVSSALPPENLNDDATFIPFYQSFTISKLSKVLQINVGSIPDHDWAKGWEGTWKLMLPYYNQMTTYPDQVMTEILFFEPQ